MLTRHCHLSFSESDSVRHYVIQRSGPKSFVLSDQTFVDLPAIIEFYRIHLLDVSVLTCPLPPPELLENGRLAKMYLCTAAAKFNFNPRDPEDLGFRKGEQLNIIQKTEAEWWKAQSTTTLMIGVIPANYVEETGLGPMGIAIKEAEEAAKERERLAREEAAAPPPPIPGRKPNPAIEAEKRRKEEELRAREEARRREREEEERQEAEARREEERLRAEAVRAAEDERRKKEAERKARVAEGNKIVRPKFIMARAELDRQANVFDKSALTFKEGDVIHVRKQNENGLWEGSVLDGRRKGRKGHFPFTFVELMDSGEFDEDIKKLRTEFQLQALKSQGVDVNKLVAKGQEAPPPLAARRAPAAPSRAPTGGDAPSAPPPVPGRRAAPPIPTEAPAVPGRRAPPPAPVAAPDEDLIYGAEDDGDLIYGADDDDEFYGAAEAFDASAVDEMMDEIYGTA